MTESSRALQSIQFDNFGKDKSIKIKVRAVLVFAFAPALGMADDVPCPPPESEIENGVREAPSEMFSVDYSEADGEHEYTFLIDLYFGESSLDAVVLLYVSDDKVLLLTSVEPLRLETQAAVNLIVDESISSKVRLHWSYTEPDKICPKTVRFEYRFTGTSAD